MSPFRKLIAGDDVNKTRLHTRRGDYVGLRPALRALRQRSAKGLDPEPWIAPPAIAHLATLLNWDDRFLEVGAGASTVWFARRVGSVVSIEDHEDWAVRVETMLNSAGLTNAILVRGQPRDALDGVLDGQSVVLIDHLDTPGWNRLDTLQRVLERGEARMVILDDSDRPEYGRAGSMLIGWTELRHVGIRPDPFMATETTIWLRPA